MAEIQVQIQLRVPLLAALRVCKCAEKAPGANMGVVP